MPSFECIDPYTDSLILEAVDLDGYQDLASDISDDDILEAVNAISEVDIPGIQLHILNWCIKSIDSRIYTNEFLRE